MTQGVLYSLASSNASDNITVIFYLHPTGPIALIAEQGSWTVRL